MLWAAHQNQVNLQPPKQLRRYLWFLGNRRRTRGVKARQPDRFWRNTIESAEMERKAKRRRLRENHHIANACGCAMHQRQAERAQQAMMRPMRRLVGMRTGRGNIHHARLRTDGNRQPLGVLIGPPSSHRQDKATQQVEGHDRQPQEDNHLPSLRKGKEA